MKTAIVTFEFPGFSRNGGIGTSYGRLAHHLASQGHKVTVFFIAVERAEYQEFAGRKITGSHGNIRIKICRLCPEFASHSWAMAHSLSVLKELGTSEFNVIHFHDCLGLGWVATQAQKFGLALQNSKVIMGMHGPTSWVLDAHGYFSDDRHEILQGQMEKQSAENAQFVVSPSQFMLDYLSSWGWTFPEKVTRVIPNINNFAASPTPLRKSKSFAATPPPRGVREQKIKRLVFFGRLEPRKGLMLFLESLSLIAESPKFMSPAQDPLQIIFMGKDTRFQNGVKASVLIEKHFHRLPDKLSYQIKADLDSDECAQYFKRYPDSLICIPSLSDNSPYTVVEALEQGLNFIATSSGGQKELVHPDSLLDTIVDPDPKVFAEKVLAKLNSRYENPKAAPEILRANESWIGFHREVLKQQAFKRPQLVSKICLVLKTTGSGGSFPQTLGPLLAQAAHLEQILVFNTGREINEAQRSFALFKKFAKGKVKLFHAIETLPADLVNKCLAETKATHFLFLQDGDFLAPDAVERALTVLSRSDKTAHVFGYSVHGQMFFPHPIDMNFTSFSDSYTHFPALFHRDFLKMRAMRKDLSYDQYLGLDNEELVLDSLEKQSTFAVVPLQLLSSKFRKEFHAYSRCKAEVVIPRIRAIGRNLPPALHKSLELAAGYVIQNGD